MPCGLTQQLNARKRTDISHDRALDPSRSPWVHVAVLTRRGVTAWQRQEAVRATGHQVLPLILLEARTTLPCSWCSCTPPPAGAPRASVSAGPSAAAGMQALPRAAATRNTPLGWCTSGAGSAGPGCCCCAGAVLPVAPAAVAPDPGAACAPQPCLCPWWRTRSPMLPSLGNRGHALLKDPGCSCLLASMPCGCCACEVCSIEGWLSPV